MVQRQELKNGMNGIGAYGRPPASVAVLGAGGLGMAAAQMLLQKKSMRLVAIADSQGVAIDHESGLSYKEVYEAEKKYGTVGAVGIRTRDSIGRVIEEVGLIDGVFIALPSLENDFIPGILKRFADAGYRGAMVDVLKRTGAVEQVLELHGLLQESQITHVTGTGATPGLLTAAANLAAQSYQEILDVKIEFGVGISSWEEYRATIREDIAHLEGFNLEMTSKMTCDDIVAELNRRNGVLKLVEMDHADGILLDAAGVASADRVHVGGVVDTRNPRKPVSTTVRVTGRTFDGFTSTHTFTLGDETTMAANVLGPGFGWLTSAIELHNKGVYGVFGSAEIMPKFTP